MGMDYYFGNELYAIIENLEMNYDMVHSCLFWGKPNGDCNIEFIKGKVDNMDEKSDWY